MYIEKIDNFNIKIDKCYKITYDAIKLADYVIADDVEKESMLEIGSGSGYISLKLAKKFKNIVAVEIQEEASKNLEENIKNNEIKNIIVINEDIKKHKGKYDVIISNPPFFKLNSGKLPSDRIKLISKFEKELSLEELISTTNNLLNNKGIFYFIYPKERENEILKELKKYNLKILDIKIIDKRLIIKGGKYEKEKKR